MNPRLEQINPIPILIAILGCGLALYLGTASGAGNYINISRILAVAGLAAYFLYFYQFTWHMMVLLVATDMTFRPVGFSINSPHINLLLLTLFLVAVLWRKPRRIIVPFCKTNAFQIFIILYVLGALYLLLHGIYNTLSPYRPEEFSYKSMLKTYFGGVLTPLFVAFICTRLGLFKVRANFANTLGVLILLGLVFNIIVRLIYIRSDPGGDDPTVLFIPIINAASSVYILRTLGPFAVLLGTVFFSAEYFRTTPRPGRTRFIFGSLIVLGLMGSALSGGRASIVIALFFIGAALFVLKRYAKLITFTGVMITLLFILNLIAPALRSLPFIYQRSLQWVLLEKNPLAVYSIEDSSRWRDDLYQRAIEEWRSSPRVFWFGRSTYSYDEADLRGRLARDSEKILESSLRRGATHNDLSDSLLLFGLFGTILNYLIDLARLYVCWALYRMTARVDRSVSLLACVCFVASAVSVGVGFFASGSVLNPVWLLLIIMLSRLATQEKEARMAEAEPEKPMKGSVRQFALRNA